MAGSFAKMQGVLSYVATHLEDEVSLAALAARAGLSPFHLHRVFANTLRETPKQLAFRLRLGRAAVLLLTTDDSVLDVALSCGFQSHEVFCRAFRRRFHMTPRAYRERGFAQKLNASQARDHVAIVNQVAPCVALYRISQEIQPEENDMPYSVTRKELSPQPVLVVRCRVKRSDIAKTIGETLPKIFMYAQQHGIALAGLPFTRYTEIGPGLMTMEPGMRIASGAPPATKASGEEVVMETLPGGPAATTLHIGPYDGLHDAYVAIEQWMAAQGLAAKGAPWESYVTDPGEYPDPKDWKTEVFWPCG
ncbi:MAG TPA: helix-turn-helix domain-containing protein [Bryobacteraceae bacterium]|nr:helix-turn-helix domain-containing protein [Bryobacteraceae bacterium]